MKNPITTGSFKTFVAAVSLLLLSSTLMAQVGIGIATPAPTAQLDITSTNKGLLIPRMNAAARTGILSPATGLMVYQTDAPAGFYYFDGASWNAISTSGVNGFSASISTVAASASTTLTGWNVAAPFYNIGSLNPTTGQFVAPSTGTYAITATINYKTSTALSVSLGAGVNPYFEVVRTLPSTASLLQGYFPVLDVNILLLLTLKAILGTGVVTLAGNVNLTAGDVITLQYNANGLAGVNLNLGNSLPAGIVWTVTKLK